MMKKFLCFVLLRIYFVVNLLPVIRYPFDGRQLKQFVRQFYEPHAHIEPLKTTKYKFFNILDGFSKIKKVVGGQTVFLRTLFFGHYDSLDSCYL